MPLKSKPTLVLPPTLQHQMLEGDVDYWPALRAWLERSGRRDVNGTVDEYGRTLLFYAANAGRLDRNFRVGASLDWTKNELSAVDAILRREPPPMTCYTASRRSKYRRSAWIMLSLFVAPLPHRNFLRLRSLVVRRRAVANDALLARLVRLPNSTVWHVLTYWRGDRLPAV